MNYHAAVHSRCALFSVCFILILFIVLPRYKLMMKDPGLVPGRKLGISDELTPDCWGNRVAFPKCSLEPLSWKGHLLWRGTSSLQMQASHTTGREYPDRKRLLAVIPGPSPISAKGSPRALGKSLCLVLSSFTGV